MQRCFWLIRRAKYGRQTITTKLTPTHSHAFIHPSIHPFIFISLDESNPPHSAHSLLSLLPSLYPSFLQCSGAIINSPSGADTGPALCVCVCNWCGSFARAAARKSHICGSGGGGGGSDGAINYISELLRGDSNCKGQNRTEQRNKGVGNESVARTVCTQS